MLGADELSTAPPPWDDLVFGFDKRYHECENKQGEHSFSLSLPA